MEKRQSRHRRTLEIDIVRTSSSAFFCGTRRRFTLGCTILIRRPSLRSSFTVSDFHSIGSFWTEIQYAWLQTRTTFYTIYIRCHESRATLKMDSCGYEIIITVHSWVVLISFWIITLRIFVGRLLQERVDGFVGFRQNQTVTEQRVDNQHLFTSTTKKNIYQIHRNIKAYPLDRR